jgi:transcription antitermination factor NusG
MPILQAEPDLFPDNLLTEANPEALRERQWWALHVKPRQEKSLARQLFASRIPFYLPLQSRRLLVRGRVMTSRVPLFAGYLFLLGNRDDRVNALATARVVRSLPVADQDGLWRDLRQVHRLIRTGAPVTPEDRLAPGMAVEIRSGPLAGLRGKILEVASRRRFVVEVDFIQRGASVLMDDLCLAPAEA